MTINKMLPRSTPESQGISSEAILSFLNAIEESKLELHSFMLLSRGHVVSEGWWHPYVAERPHMLFSLSKSFTSTAIGFAVEEGLLIVEDKVLSFFSQELPEKISDNLADMKVKHLLSMSTGHDTDASDSTFGCEDGNWVKSFLSLEVQHEPGTHFVYNTAATYMLSAIIQKLTGMTLLEYLTPRLFKPLGIEGATWEKCPRGINTGGFGLSIKTEDIAKFGQLYLQKGQWEGKQIINHSWIEEATSSHISNGDNPLSDWNQGYGYQFWRCRHNAYRGDGAFGQYCVVLPEQEAVIAITSGIEDMQEVLNHIWEILLPAISPSSLPENLSVQDELKEKLQCLNLPVITGQETNPVSQVINDKQFVMEKNDINLQTVSFRFEEDECNFIMNYPHGEEIIKCSYKEYKEGIANLIGYPSPVAACGSWQDNYTFLMLLRLVETPFCYTLNCKFKDDIVELKMSVNVNFGPKEFPAIVGKIV
jgi:hypothetical protein